MAAAGLDGILLTSPRDRAGDDRAAGRAHAMRVGDLAVVVDSDAGVDAPGRAARRRARRSASWSTSTSGRAGPASPTPEDAVAPRPPDRRACRSSATAASRPTTAICSTCRAYAERQRQGRRAVGPPRAVPRRAGAPPGLRARDRLGRRHRHPSARPRRRAVHRDPARLLPVHGQAVRRGRARARRLAPFRTSLTVATRVVSTSQPDRVIVDAGFKAMATDAGPALVASGAPADATYQFMGDEHGGRALRARARRARRSATSSPASRRTATRRSTCTTVFHVVRGRPPGRHLADRSTRLLRGQRPMKTIVLGGGVIGTTTAYYLAKLGHEVHLVERQAGVGDGDQLRQRRRAAHQRGRALVAARHAAQHPGAGWARRTRPMLLRYERAAQDVALGPRLRAQLHARALPPRDDDQPPALASTPCSASRRSATRPAIDYDLMQKGTMKIYTRRRRSSRTSPSARRCGRTAWSSRSSTPRAASRSSRRWRRSATPSSAASTSRPTSTATATSSRSASRQHCEQKLGVRCHFGTEVKALRRAGDRIEAVETARAR